MSRLRIPYSRQSVGQADYTSVREVLESEWLTTGPTIDRFEEEFAGVVGAPCAVAVSSGTAALHTMFSAFGVSAEDEVIMSPVTFAASANAVLYCGGKPVFVDVDPDTLLIDPMKIESAITTKTKAILAVDYAGQACDYSALKIIANRHKLYLLADACHSLGGEYLDMRVGSIADATAFSFHPVKAITTGEGGMITFSDPTLAKRARQFRNHGITTDFREREEKGTFFYDVSSSGFNYRISDINCALGRAQLKRLRSCIDKRNEIAKKYSKHFHGHPYVLPLVHLPEVLHAYHLYVVRVSNSGGLTRDSLYAALREHGIGTNVHYRPVYLHSYYQRMLNLKSGLCPNAETAYQQILSLPIFPTLASSDISTIVSTIDEICARLAKF